MWAHMVLGIQLCDSCLELKELGSATGVLALEKVPDGLGFALAVGAEVTVVW